MNYGVNTYGADMFKEQESAGLGRTIIRVKLKEEEGLVTCLEAMIDGEPTTDDFESLRQSHLAQVKHSKLLDVSHYDISDEVNGFKVNGKRIWLDKATRVGLVNSLNVEKATGKEMTTLWFDDVSYTLSVENALELLSQVELYAIACYNKTAEHRVAINTLTTPEDVEAFDITAGYPEQPNFVI